MPSSIETTCEAVYDVLFASSEKIVRSGAAHTMMLAVAKIQDGDWHLSLGSLEKLDKQSALNVFHGMAMADDTLFAVLISEAWIAMNQHLTGREIEQLRDGEASVADLASRQEAIVFSFLGKTVRKIAICVIDRENSALIKDKLESLPLNPEESKGRLFPAAKPFH